VAAAIRWMGKKYPAVPLTLIGYSFGAWVGLRVGCAEPSVKALVGIAPPLDLYDFEFLTRNAKPSLYIAGTRDEFCSRGNLARLETRLPDTSSVRILEGAEHFFLEQTEAVEKSIFDFFHTLRLDRHSL
jgi:alpha/beta superfamily hydrolase